METKNGRVRFTADEVASDQRLMLLGEARFGQPTPPDGFLYLKTFGDQEPWLTFNRGGFVKPIPQLPAGFKEIYGERPTGPAATNELRGLQQFWDQQLGLWRDNKKPDWVTAEREAEASVIFQAHGMGRMLPYRLTNGAEFACFPEANLAGRRAELPLWYELPARIAYELTEHGIAMYQMEAKQEGNDIPLNQLVGFLTNRRFHSQ